MRKPTALAALLAAGCTTPEPAYVRPTPEMPASGPAGDPYLRQSEAALPAVTYQRYEAEFDFADETLGTRSSDVSYLIYRLGIAVRL